MQDSVFMDVLQSNADFKEEPPYFLLLKRSLILQLQELIEIAIVAVLHNDVEIVFLDEWLFVAYNEGMDQFAHNRGLIDCLHWESYTFFFAFSLNRLKLICLSTQTSRVNLFKAL